jgi:elongation factor 3
MDEPTNFLDREALGALSAALNTWGGAVLMISHNKEFYSSVCKEIWTVDDGRLSVEGMSSEREMKAVARKIKYEKDLDNEEILEKAGGNVNAAGDKYKDATVNFWGQTVSKKDARQYEKAKKRGDVPAMRKILQVSIFFCQQPAPCPFLCRCTNRRRFSDPCRKGNARL